MTVPSAKIEFSNKGMAKLLGELYFKKYNVAWNHNGERLKLVINGDLKDDILGFDINLEVRGDVLSTVDISGNLETNHVKTSGGKNINVNNLVMATLSNIEGDGLVNVRGNICGNMYSIDGEGNGLTLNCAGDVMCSKIGNNVQATIGGALTIGTLGINTNGLETHITANYIKTDKITGNKANVFSAADIDVTSTISGGAKVYAGGKISLRSVGCPVGRGCGYEGRTLVYAGKVEMRTLPYNAEILSAEKIDIKNLNDPYKGFRNPWPKEPLESTMTNFSDLENLTDDMIDFIRLGYSTIQKHSNAHMPEKVAQEVHRRFAPT